MISRLEMHSYMGVTAKTYEFPPNGGVVEGRNGAGKSTVLKAIRADLGEHKGCPMGAHCPCSKCEVFGARP